MTGIPSDRARFTAGSTASASHARTTSTLAPRVIKFSMSAACFSFEPWASALMYLPPAFSIAAFMAASSRFQRSSWKFDQDTPTVCANTVLAPHSTLAATPAVTIESAHRREIIMRCPPDSVMAEFRYRLCGLLVEDVKAVGTTTLTSPEAAMQKALQKTRWGVLSTSRFAQTKILPALRHAPHVEVAAIASRDLDRARQVAAEFA